MEQIALSFASGARHCDIRLGPGAFDALAGIWAPGWRQAALIGDSNVLGRFATRVEDRLRGRTERLLRLPFEPGEASKTRATKQALEDQLLEAGFDRQACLVGLGGGVSLDLAGFVAATYLRSVDWLALPTSLLAQVDAAVGGKTGVNTRHGKNLVGAFHQPAAVLIDTDLPASLPAAEWRCGLAEMVKHAFVADAGLFERLERDAVGLCQPGPLDPWLVGRCVRIKAAIVQADEREAGRRAWLNFGHTIGHAIERASGFSISHGLAVARGMLVEAGLAARRSGLDPGSVERLARLLDALGFGQLPAPPFESLLPHLRLDKKNRAGRIRVALPAAVGAMAGDGAQATLAVDEDELREVYPR